MLLSFSGFLNILIRVALGLILDQRSDTITDGDHALDTTLGSSRYIDRIHTAVLTVVNLTVHNCETEIADIRISGDRKVFILCFKIVDFIFGDLRMDVLNCILKKLSEM